MGRYPEGTVNMATNGKLYGMTRQGGIADQGVLFEYDHTANVFTKKIDFSDFINGKEPHASLTQTASGNLYGLTRLGGGSNLGVLFKYDLNTGSYTRKWSFDGAQSGSYPEGDLLEAAGGKLYGLTFQGGANDVGALFEYDPAADTLVKKVDFNEPTIGGYPRDGLVQTGSLLYGLAYAGGANGVGTLFEYDPVLDTLIKKIDFDGTGKGSLPRGSLTLLNGKLYGLTYKGGASNNGVLFEYDPGSNGFSKKWDFDGAANGRYPYGSLELGPNGKLYGMTREGGANGFGVLFEYDPANGFSKKHDFDGTGTGRYPEGSLVLAPDGKLYGMTSEGGAYGGGIVFQYDPSSNTLSKIYDLNGSGSEGYRPFGSLIVNTYCPSVQDSLTVSICQGETYTFNGQALNTTGTYLDTLAAANGCDSIVYLDLTVHPTFLFTEYHAACDNELPYQWRGDTYNLSGTYFDSLLTANGCDSVFQLILTVTPNTVVAVTGPDLQMCEGDQVTLDGSGSSAGAAFTYAWSPGASLNDSTLVMPTASPADTTQYVLTVTDTTTGCFALDSMTVNVLPLPILTLNPAGPFCQNDPPYDLTQSEDPLYPGGVWSGPGVSGSQFSPAGLAGQIVLNYEYSDGNCTGSASLSVEVLIVQNTSVTDSFCLGEVYIIGGSTFPNPGNYQVTLQGANGCDSIIDLTLTQIAPIPPVFVSDSFCVNEFYVFNGDTLTDAGVYSYTLTGANGCDSVVNLTLSELPVDTTDFSETICENETYPFNGQSLNMPGVYLDTLSQANGCDSILRLTLTVLPVDTTDLTATICENETYPFNGQSLNTPGVYLDTLSQVNGCDSILRLTLTVLPVDTTDLSETICENETYPFNGQSLNMPGVYLDTLSQTNGCDSILRLTLTVSNDTLSILNEGICQGGSYNFNGQILTAPGIYYDTLATYNGCDSILMLDLTVSDTIKKQISASICPNETYTVGDSTFNQAGMYEVVLTAVNGCDSVVYLNLAVGNAPVITNASATKCEGVPYTYGNQTFFLPGVYQLTYPTANGCDSIVNFTLTQLDTSVVTADTTICQGAFVVVGTDTFDMTGNYEVVLQKGNGCDSTVLLNLTVLDTAATSLLATICSNETFTVGNEDFDSTGVYTVYLTAANGCDSVVHLELTVLDTAATLLTDTICSNETFPVGNEDFDSTGVYTVYLTAANGCDSVVHLNLTVFDTVAVSLIDTTFANQPYEVSGQFFDSTGVYTIVLQATNGCDSVVHLDLTVLDTFLTILPPVFICENESYLVGDSTFNQTGMYEVILTAANGGDSVVLLNLTVWPVFEVFDSVEICQGESVMVGSSVYSTSGTYLDTLATVHGCDSIVHTFLQVNPLGMFTLSPTLCRNESMVVGGTVFNFNNPSGTVTLGSANQYGCDSIVQVDLSFYPEVAASISAIGSTAVCEGESVSLQMVLSGKPPFNLSYTNGTDIFTTILTTFNFSITTPVAGTYQVLSLTDANNCSATNLTDAVEVTILPMPMAPFIYIDNGYQSFCLGDSSRICASPMTGITWSNGETSSCIWVKDAGNYTATRTSADGCTSLPSNVLTVNVYPVPSASISPADPLTLCEGDTLTACCGPSFYWSSDEFTPSISVTNSGTYSVTISNDFSCWDSASVVVDVLPAPTPVISQQGGLLNAGIWQSYQWYLDGALLPGDTLQTLMPVQNGMYAVEVTDANGCMGISPNFFYTMTAVNTLPGLSRLDIFPNPASTRLTVEMAFDHPVQDLRLELYDVLGRRVWSAQYPPTGADFRETVDVGQLAPGVYELKIGTGSGGVVRKVVVQK